MKEAINSAINGNISATSNACNPHGKKRPRPSTIFHLAAARELKSKVLFLYYTGSTVTATVLAAAAIFPVIITMFLPVIVIMPCTYKAWYAAFSIWLEFESRH